MKRKGVEVQFHAKRHFFNKITRFNWKICQQRQGVRSNLKPLCFLFCALECFEVTCSVGFFYSRSAVYRSTTTPTRLCLVISVSEEFPSFVVVESSQDRKSFHGYFEMSPNAVDFKPPHSKHPQSNRSNTFKFTHTS